MSIPGTQSNPNIAIYVVILAGLTALGGGSAWVFQRHVKPMMEPEPPPRVSSKIIQDACNVAPPEQVPAARLMIQCLQTGKKIEPGDENTLRSKTRECELNVLRTNPKEREPGLEAAKRRWIATRELWPDEALIKPADYATPIAVVATPKPRHRWDTFGTPDLVMETWQKGATTTDEKKAAQFLVDCLKLDALEGTNVPLLHKRASRCEAMSAQSATLLPAARNTVVFNRDRLTHTYWLGDEPQPMTQPGLGKTLADIKEDTIAPPSTVQQAWKQTSNSQELIEADALERCLNQNPGALNASVMVCELRAMNQGDNKAVDAVLARRAKLLPHIPGPGARFAGEASAPPAIPSIAKASELNPKVENQDAFIVPEPTDSNGMSDTLPGASELFAQWKQVANDAGTPQVAEMLVDCMKKTPIISPDSRGLKVASDVCKLRVEVEIKKQAEASRVLLNVEGGSP